jgi:hypothetical protein
MFASLKQNLTLWLREKTGLTATFLVFVGIAAMTALMPFIFLVVSGYAWAAAELGPVFGALATAGVFLLIAACSWVAASLGRARAKKRAILERAALKRNATPLMNPMMFRIAMQAARTIGWQRLIPIALLGFLATQPVHERRQGHAPDEI